ncbi:MAG TPA: hypothetical protein EYG03_23560 [Planctomycetes bacterium]|nr:hypothetical protein [Planctomycetota bacterium]
MAPKKLPVALGSTGFFGSAGFASTMAAAASATTVSEDSVFAGASAVSVSVVSIADESFFVGVDVSGEDDELGAFSPPQPAIVSIASADSRRVR